MCYKISILSLFEHLRVRHGAAVEGEQPKIILQHFFKVPEGECGPDTFAWPARAAVAMGHEAASAHAATDDLQRWREHERLMEA